MICQWSRRYQRMEPREYTIQGCEMMAAVTSRQRVLTTLGHRQPDRPPVFMTLTPQVAERLADAVGFPREPPLDSLLSTRISHSRLLTYLGNDAVGIAACAPPYAPTHRDEDGTLVNEWGMRFRTVGLYDEFSGHPLARATTVAEIEAYPLPDPLAEGRYDEAEQTVQEYGSDYVIVGDLECSMFETAWYLVGLEKFLADMATGEGYAEALLDRLAEITTRTGLELIRRGADVIWAGDDFGTQERMLLSPAMWRRVFKPRIWKMFEAFRKEKRSIKLAWHSCGSIAPIIHDFVELGLHILNPIQPRAEGMEPRLLKREYGRDLAFFGGLDIQELLPRGTPQQVKDEVAAWRRSWATAVATSSPPPTTCRTTPPPRTSSPSSRR
jgi:uroporphyrinogen decarboxylase